MDKNTKDIWIDYHDDFKKILKIILLKTVGISTVFVDVGE
jgi:hypothetical protein